jgi:YgiT-type zinc finger domain-containing protein
MRVKHCVMCKGNTEPKLINHIIDIDGHITIIKNVPAVVCKQCGESFLEHKIALKIEKLLDAYSDNKVEVLIINFYDKVA